MRLVVTVADGTAHRVLLVLLVGTPHEVVVTTDGSPRLDVASRVVHVDDRTVPVVLRTPRAGEVGIVEDLLVDRAFEDVPGEATVLAELRDVAVATVEDLHELLAAAALARAAGVSADAVRTGLRTLLTG